jgi:hypothetical protein
MPDVYTVFPVQFYNFTDCRKKCGAEKCSNPVIQMCNRCPAAPASRYRHIAEGGHPGLPSFAGTPWQAKVTGVCIFNNGSR